MYFNERFYFFPIERAYCVWGATIFSCTIEKEIHMEKYPMEYITSRK